MRLRAGVLGATTLVLVTAACGGGRPSGDEISDTLQKGVSTSGGSDVKLTEQQADCAAKVFLASDLSDEALRAVADGERGYKLSTTDEDAEAKIQPQLADCVTG
ncbi:hypothetical protein GCM10011519_03510 [Marmoricola endophyticus]|uniref:Uncharacterized protein n=1 Tax=Marmoricola endophyticus TaxID=2040280 RepID=A0A917BAX1_9ACTN|nr:hypothetical protein [Marmoricola endophyticus]GGF33362.1 hypothetical protein GCM10011519_03510 [Marmoricola endophyticus]